MANRIASLMDIPPTLGAGDLLDVEDLAFELGVPPGKALELTQLEGFPAPAMKRHRYVANERLPRPQRVWNRSEVEAWAEERIRRSRQAAVTRGKQV